MAKYKIGDRFEVLYQNSMAYVGDIVAISGFGVNDYFQIVNETRPGKDFAVIESWLDAAKLIQAPTPTKPAPVYAWQWGQERNPETEFKGSSFYGWDEDWD